MSMSSAFFMVPGWGKKTPLDDLVDRINAADMELLDKIIKKLFITQATNAEPLIEALIRDYSHLPRVCYVIARLYAGKFVNKVFQPIVLMPNQDLTVPMSNQDRSARAIYYAKLAVEMNFDEATKFLFLSLTMDLGTCIRTIPENTRQENLADLHQLLIKQILIRQVLKQKCNFAALFDFACYKLNYCPRSPKVKFLENKTSDKNEAFKDFSIILQSSDVEYIGNTIEVLYLYFDSAEKTIIFLNKEFEEHQSEWLGLILATLYSPVEINKDMKDRFKSFEVLQQAVPLDISRANNYLNLIYKPNNFDKLLNYFIINLKQTLKKIEESNTYSSQRPRF